MKVITFLIGARWCAMPVDQLVEILPARELLPLPQSPSSGSRDQSDTILSTAGIVDYRGRAIPVIRLQLEPPAGNPGDQTSSPSARRRFLVLNARPAAAIEVGRVDAVIDLDDQSIQPPGDVGLQAHGVVSGVCRLHDAYAFVIDGTSITAMRGAAGMAAASTSAVHGGGADG